MIVLFFETDIFNLSEEQGHFINPDCFGEDFANWLKPLLENDGVLVDDIYQEDWGWELSCKLDDREYYLGVGGLPEEDGSNVGEWRVMFTKRRSLVELLIGKSKLAKDEKIIGLIRGYLSSASFSSIKLDLNA